MGILRRLESGERWWAAEIVLRSLGLALLMLCAATASWLCSDVHQPQFREPRPLDFAAALLVFLGWSLGWALFVVGPGLFRLVPVPPRYRRFSA